MSDQYGGGAVRPKVADPSIAFCDEYEHPDDAIEYIFENCPAEFDGKQSSANLIRLFNEVFVENNCKCDGSDECTNFSGAESCSHGGNYKLYDGAADHKKELVLNSDRPSKHLIYECSTLCRCHHVRCQNRLVQFGPRKQLKIVNKTMLSQQLGLITTAFIPKGGFICEYVGEALTLEQSIRRAQLNDQRNEMNYIICLNEISTDERNRIQTFIDPSRRGNIGRYLNHSCDPNCEIMSVRIDEPVPKLSIFSNRDIAPYEELCFDYSDGMNNEQDTVGTTENTVKEPFGVVPNRKPCLCGTTKCRKYLPNFGFQ